MKPRFVKGIWVGLLDSGQFVVFDPSIKNLFTHTLQGSLVYLWELRTKAWTQFDVSITRPILRSNSSRVTESDRQRIAAIYWSWKCQAVGAQGHTPFAYANAEGEHQHVMAMLAMEDDEWFARYRAIQLGEDPNQ